ncbi:TOBE domain-containing protein [Hydrogenovibrio sp. 3SP14C1]|uniref:TOBE domain-containing protein n=1 Tax=Hydrogenovibrio sp. 3SP14C1 TaxID=3038774 RepID=UPI002417067E|nr:TOBE domain-containing protein [Hydrogenovibrio sp. 3SP14C1]MDG4812576.1 TOBE domain-containing protein [Hydrogenovibrio sp. 3SP14C1]
MSSEQSSEQLVQSFLMGSKQSQSGQRRLDLLNKIDALGSLSAAAKACGMSYKGAWQAVEAMNQLSGVPLVTPQKGGAGGGGMVLTQAGRSLVAAYQLFNEQMQHWLRELETMSPDVLSQLDLMRKISMKTSARNLFHGSVTKIEKGAVNCDVTLAIGGGSEVVAQITRGSLERLALEVGSDAYALIKASWVILMEPQKGAFKTSARNQFCGSIMKIDVGEINSDVSIQLEGDQAISAIVTNQSVASLGLVAGHRCCALVKASHVLLAVSD